MKFNNIGLSVFSYAENPGIMVSILFLVFVLVACRKHTEMPKPKNVNNTVIVFMAANNNLKSAALNSINEMESAAKNLDGNLYVFVKTSGYRSDILKIKFDETNNLVSDTIKTYGNENTSNPNFLTKVIADIKNISPSKSYGLILWSHGRSWYPPLNNAPQRPVSAINNKEILLKSFGYDRGEVMDIVDLKNTLPPDLKFILFDACSMGSLEVAFELKDNANYIISSPTEILSYSFPYNKIIPLLFSDIDNFKQIGEQYINTYNLRTGIAQSASVSVVKTAGLQELAIRTRKMLEKKTFKNNDFTKSEIQRLDFDENTQIPAYDFLDFLYKNFDKDEYSLVEQQFNNVIIYKGSTHSFLSRPIKQFGGLSTYLPTPNDINLNYYKQLNWYNQAGYLKLFYP